jgi:hypothetical protein
MRKLEITIEIISQKVDLRGPKMHLGLIKMVLG